MRTYEVSVSGYGSSVYTGDTPAQARAAAWREFQSAYECTFKAFLKMSSVRKIEMPPSAGYSYVKRTYGVDAQAGQTVVLRNEGSWNGTRGIIVYPGTSTAHVHVKVDGHKRPLIVHPDNIEIIAS